MASLKQTIYPCKDCPDRHLGCHDGCEKYKAIKEKDTELKRKRSEERRRNKAIGELHEHRRTKKSSNRVLSTRRK